MKGSNGRGHFVFVTNLAPCSGVRIHLWPEKHRSSIENEVPASKRIVEVTSKMVQIPAGPAPKQVISLTVNLSCSYILAFSIFLVHVRRFLVCTVYHTNGLNDFSVPNVALSLYYQLQHLNLIFLYYVRLLPNKITLTFSVLSSYFY